MDTVIRSQIESPLCRALQSIPTNSSNYVHGIPDNSPPFSRSQVIIDKSEGQRHSLDGDQVFKIPQGGHLSGMYLRYRSFGSSLNDGSTFATDAQNCFQFGNGVESIQLRTDSNVIQTLYSSSIPFEALSRIKGSHTKSNMLRGLQGYIAAQESPGNYTDEIEAGHFKTIQPDAGLVHSNSVDTTIMDFLIPLPFSILFYQKDHLQTRLLEDLEIVVKMRKTPQQSHSVQKLFSISNEHHVTLVAEFMNYHENVEETIRNANFKPNVPAELLSNDQNIVRALYQRESEKQSQRTLVYVADLKGDGLLTDLFVVPRITLENQRYSRCEGFLKQAVRFVIKSGGETLFEASKGEIDGFGGAAYSTIGRQYQNVGVLPERWKRCGTHIRLGLNNSDEMFDGGISLQSLVDPVLEIHVTIDVSNLPTSVWEFPVDQGAGQTSDLSGDGKFQLKWDVVMKKKVMLRIDGNTGTISKSMES